ncbi:MAG: NAD-dependent epimerase/dehydratase family protein [Pirellulales bacterium]
MSRVLITGASGFIGAHLAEALVARGDDVTCLVRRTSQVERLKPLAVRLAYGDVCDPESLAPCVAGTEVVYHLAGLTKALRVADLMRVNEQGVRNVAEACALCQTPPVLVLVSSLAAAGPCRKTKLRTEDDPPHPVSNYGRSKRAGELAAEALAGKVPITVIRPPIVFGEGDAASLQMIKPIVRFRIHATPGTELRVFSLIHAADLATVLILAAQRGARLEERGRERGQGSGVGGQGAEATAPSSRGYYFAACGEHPTYGDLGRLIGKAAGRRFVLVVRMPEVVTWAAAGATELVSRILRRPNIFCIDKAREATAGSWACSSERIGRELGFTPGATLLERFQQTIAWYYREGWL